MEEFVRFINEEEADGCYLKVRKEGGLFDVLMTYPLRMFKKNK